MGLAGLAVAAALASGASWQDLPRPAERWGDVTGVRAGQVAVFVAAEHGRVAALAFDLRLHTWTRLRGAPGAT